MEKEQKGYILQSIEAFFNTFLDKHTSLASIFIYRKMLFPNRDKSIFFPKYPSRSKAQLPFNLMGNGSAFPLWIKRSVREVNRALHLTAICKMPSEQSQGRLNFYNYKYTAAKLIILGVRGNHPRGSQRVIKVNNTGGSTNPLVCFFGTSIR